MVSLSHKRRGDFLFLFSTTNNWITYFPQPIELRKNTPNLGMCSLITFWNWINKPYFIYFSLLSIYHRAHTHTHTHTFFFFIIFLQSWWVHTYNVTIWACPKLHTTSYLFYSIFLIFFYIAIGIGIIQRRTTPVLQYMTETDFLPKEYNGLNQLPSVRVLCHSYPATTSRYHSPCNMNLNPSLFGGETASPSASGQESLDK